MEIRQCIGSLAFLASDLQSAILDGCKPETMTLGKPLPVTCLSRICTQLFRNEVGSQQAKRKPTKQIGLERLTEIANLFLNIETLESRNCDWLGFHDVPIWSLRAAPKAAFAAGQASKSIQHAGTN